MSKIAVSSPASGTATYTISAPAGSTDRTLTLPDNTGTILTTATAGVPVNGPAFSAYKTTNQSLSNATWTKVSFQAEEFDTANAFDSAGTQRFQPLVAGYYQINWGIGGESSSGIFRLLSAVWKNGGEFRRSTDLSVIFGITGSTIVFLNGSTDYVEVYAYISASVSTVTAGSPLTYFQAALIRSAT